MYYSPHPTFYCTTLCLFCFSFFKINRYGGPTTTVIQVDAGHYPTDKQIKQYFLRIHTLMDSTTGTTRTIIEPPITLRNSLPISLRISFRQFFPNAGEKETSLPHIVRAGTEEEVYDVNTLAHAFAILTLPSMLSEYGTNSNGCSTSYNGIHIKSIWCDGAETSTTRKPRDYEFDVKATESTSSSNHTMAGLRVRVTDSVDSILAGGSGSGTGPLRIEVSAKLWIVNLTNLPLEYGDDFNGINEVIPPFGDIPDTRARLINHYDLEVGMKLRMKGTSNWSDDHISLDLTGGNKTITVRTTNGRRIPITCSVDNGPLAFGLGRMTVLTCVARHALRVYDDGLVDTLEQKETERESERFQKMQRQNEHNDLNEQIDEVGEYKPSSFKFSSSSSSSLSQSVLVEHYGFVNVIQEVHLLVVKTIQKKFVYHHHLEQLVHLNLFTQKH